MEASPNCDERGEDDSNLEKEQPVSYFSSPSRQARSFSSPAAAAGAVRTRHRRTASAMDPYLAAVVHDDHRRTQQQEQHPRIVSQNAATQIAGSQHSVRVHPTQNSAVTATAAPRTPPSARRSSMYASSAPQNQWAHACDNVIATRFPENSPEHVTTTQEISERRKFHASARLIRELNTADICNVLGTTTTDLMRHDPSRVAASLLRALSGRNADSKSRLASLAWNVGCQRPLGLS